MTPSPVTETLDLLTGDVRLSDLVGRIAVFTTSDGERLFGVLAPHPFAGASLAIEFPDGRWGSTGPASVEVVVAEVTA